MAAAARMFGRECVTADCRRCQVGSGPEREHMRTMFGCDAPAPAPVWYVACPCDADPSCDECGGTGKRDFHRCPGSMIDRRADVSDFARAYVQFDGRHVLPVTGGLCDQAASFVDAVGIMDRERGLWDERTEKRREIERQRAANAGAKR